MRVLLDECLPRRLARALEGFEVQTVPEAGWAGTKNGALLGLASTAFDVFVTMDQNLEYQQNLRTDSIGVVVLKCHTNRYEDLLALVPKLTEVLNSGVEAGQVVAVGV